MVDDATVVQADIETDNGVIHVIDTVLMPQCDPEHRDSGGFGNEASAVAPGGYRPIRSTSVAAMKPNCVRARHEPGESMTTELSKVEARQGETLNPMRYVLAASLSLAVISLALVAWFVLG
jgi:Fasciclin domain